MALCAALVFASMGLAVIDDAPSRTVLKKEGDKWSLTFNGKPFFVNGAGGDKFLDKLAAYGGNSVRTWGVGPETQEFLDQAQKLGLKVTLGIWLGHERHGFNYNDPKQVQKQLESARETFRKYKSHPALFAWALGNEMEGWEDKGYERIFRAVNDMAKAAKAEDPNHPTMTVIAELAGEKVAALHKFCPDIDIVGINSYGGAPTVIDRYKKAGGTKPVILTEFGPLGPWESGKTPWNVAIEGSSTEKAKHYVESYEKAVEAYPGFVLGSYAFVWGWKQETTATWFGMLLPDGSVVGSGDAMSRKWTGKRPSNLSPVIDSITTAKTKVAPGSVIDVEVKYSDPDGDKCQLSWVLRTEATSTGFGGDDEDVQKELAGALVESSGSKATFRMPKEEAGYRLFLVIKDGKGAAATANIPLLVESPDRASRAVKVKLPFYVYRDGGEGMPWAMSGYMNQPTQIEMDPNCSSNPRSGGACLKTVFKASTGWGGVAFQHPANDWGAEEGGFNLTGATKLSFWARGETGGEKVKFEFGILDRKAKFYDTAGGMVEAQLGREWKEYSISLDGKDLARIKTGFVWTAALDGRPITFYLDDVRFE